MQRFISQSQWDKLDPSQCIVSGTQKFVIRKDPITGAQAVRVVVLPDKAIYPQPGDVVRSMSGDFPKAGSHGVINGTLNAREDKVSVCFAASAFRDDNIVSCSGGPVPFIKATELIWSGEFINREFWRWRDLPQANGGFHYFLSVPVWYWYPRSW